MDLVKLAKVVKAMRALGVQRYRDADFELELNQVASEAEWEGLSDPTEESEVDWSNMTFIDGE